MTPAQERKVKKLNARHSKLLKKMHVYKNRLKAAKTDRKKASAEKRIRRLEGRINGLLRKKKLFVEKAARSATKIVRPRKRKKVGKKTASRKAAPRKEQAKVAPKKQLDAFGKDQGLKVKDIPAEMYERISRAAHRTFEAIGNDLMTIVQDSGGHSMKRAEVIESVFDADRMSMYGGDKEAYEYCKTLKWDEIEKLGKKIFPYKTYS